MPDSVRSGGGTRIFEESGRDVVRTGWDMRISSLKTLERYLQEAPTHHAWHRISERNRRRIKTLADAAPAVATAATCRARTIARFATRVFQWKRDGFRKNFCTSSLRQHLVLRLAFEFGKRINTHRVLVIRKPNNQSSTGA